MLDSKSKLKTVLDVFLDKHNGEESKRNILFEKILQAVNEARAKNKQKIVSSKDFKRGVDKAKKSINKAQKEFSNIMGKYSFINPYAIEKYKKRNNGISELQ